MQPMPGKQVPPEIMAEMLSKPTPAGPPMGGPPPGGPPMPQGGPPPMPPGAGGAPPAQGMPMSPDALNSPEQASQLLQQLGISESALPMVAKAVAILGGGGAPQPPIQ